jgi:hypothetical protein
MPPSASATSAASSSTSADRRARTRCSAEQRRHHSTELGLRHEEAWVWSGYPFLQQIEEDAARRVIPLGVEQVRLPNRAAVTHEDVAARVGDVERAARLDRRELEDRARDVRRGDIADDRVAPGSRFTWAASRPATPATGSASATSTRRTSRTPRTAASSRSGHRNESLPHIHPPRPEGIRARPRAVELFTAALGDDAATSGGKPAVPGQKSVDAEPFTASTSMSRRTPRAGDFRLDSGVCSGCVELA